VHVSISSPLEPSEISNVFPTHKDTRNMAPFVSAFSFTSTLLDQNLP